MTQASVNIAQQFKDGGVIPADLAGQSAVSKKYVDDQLAIRDTNIAAAASVAGAAQADINNHEQSTTAHPAQNISYNGEAQGANVKQALDGIDTRIDNLVLNSGNSNPEIVDARGGFTTLGGRLNASDNKLAIRRSTFLNVMDPPSALVAPKGDGTTDDTEALQAAINASAGNGVCYIPNLTFLTKTLIIPSNSHLIIDGTLKLVGGTNDQLILIPGGNSDIVIEGSGILDGNRAAQTANLIACVFGGSVDSENIIIEGLRVRNARTWGVNLIAKKSKLLKLIISSCSNMSFFGPGSEDVEINGCEVYGVSPDWGLGFYGGVTNGILTNCIAHDCAQVGLGVLADAAQNHPSYNIVISNCISYNNGYAGIGASGGGSDGVIIANNIVYGNNKDGSAPTTQGGGINIAGVNHVRIKGNMTFGNKNAGLILTDTVSNIDISENSFFNELSLGIWTTYATISHLNITNNSFDDNQETPTMNNCINFQITTTISDSTITGNYLGRVISGQDKIYKGTINIDRITNNVGYNPVGLLPAPTIPATDNYYTNNTGYKCDVYISGGTVTDVYIDGTPTGLNRGCFSLYPGQKIAIVYTAAPTWKWFGQ